MGFKKWVVSSYDKSLAKQLANDCDIDPIVALIASSRGYSDPYELEEFLSFEPDFSSPLEMADIVNAANIINETIEKNEKITVYGDYDCDGVAATSLLYGYLKSRNANCDYYIPDRFEEGYGMNEAAIRSLASEGTKLIVTVDNGIVCFDEIQLANSLGIKVVVTDHHLPSDRLPQALAVVNPHRADCPSSFKDICGAQVAFKLICVLEAKEPEELLPLYADTLSLAVVADIMPLRNENRYIVKYGIEKLKSNPTVGLSALMNIAGIEQNKVDSGRIAFGLCPRINAAGRMGKANRAVSLLTCENMLEALKIADDIDSDNALRQQIEKKIYSEAVEIIEKEDLKYDRVIVVCGNGWHHGVIGIVASKITERYGAPAILFSSEGETATGSGRSIDGFSLYNAINSCKDILVKFGGHDQAAGRSLKTENIQNFRSAINEYANSLDYVAPELNIDLKLNPSALSLDLAFALQQLEPFGNGNPAPLFGVYGVKLIGITPLANNKHLRLSFSKGDNSFQGLLFGVSTNSFCFEIDDMLDLAVSVEANFYRGEYSVSVQIKAIRLSMTDDVKLFSDISNFNSFCSNNIYDPKALLPTREEVGSVYKFICERKVLPLRVEYFFLNSLGYAKTMIALKTLKELELIKICDDGMYVGVKGLKTNLLNSQTYKTLSERSDINE